LHCSLIPVIGTSNASTRGPYLFAHSDRRPHWVQADTTSNTYIVTMRARKAEDSQPGSPWSGKLYEMVSPHGLAMLDVKVGRIRREQVQYEASTGDPPCC
jgi:hypothetical protein